MADRPNQPEGQPEPEVWIECACGRRAPLPDAADAEPTCAACGASLAADVSIAMDARAAGVFDRLRAARRAALDRLARPQPAGPLTNGDGRPG